MTRPLIIWNLEKLYRLDAAIQRAERDGLEEVVFADLATTRNRVFYTWPLAEAEAVYQAAKDDIATAPRREYPENREGEEP